MDSPEKRSIAAESSRLSEDIKLDHKGLPLIPQPSDDPEDPLTWSRGQKYLIVCIVALVSFLGTFALASSNPAYAQIGLALDVTRHRGLLYRFIWAPISNVYGRRPVLIFSQAIAIVAGFGAAYAKSYGTILVGRFFTGFGVASGNVVTFAVVSDIFVSTNVERCLPHVASLPAGFIAQNVGWRWTIILPSILTAVCWVLIVAALPETLYVRGTPPRQIHRKILPALNRKLRIVDFARPFQMLKYFPIVVLGWFAAVAFTLGSVMPAQTVSALFRTYYKWGSARTGVALVKREYLPLEVYSGEIVSGPCHRTPPSPRPYLSNPHLTAYWQDKLMERSRKRDGRVRPESRCAPLTRETPFIYRGHRWHGRDMRVTLPLSTSSWNIPANSAVQVSRCR
ncbi:major facilitator superfamily domain-containing protein [Mycena olivaceomarginata]|nr:major facilitator superfamily domain-containing protein [Mycena olivaceomarginata]